MSKQLAPMDEAVSPKVGPADVKTGIAAVLALVLALYDANLAFLIGLSAIPASLYLFVRKLRDPQRRKSMARVIAYGGCALLLIAGPAGCALRTHLIEKNMEPVIQALEQHHKQYGSYPERLASGLEPIDPSCKDTKRKAMYSTLDNRSKYRLVCMTYAFNHHQYESENRQWIDTD
jgi:hypothetical protein